MFPNPNDFYEGSSDYCYHRSNYTIKTKGSKYFFYAIANCIHPNSCNTYHCQVYYKFYYIRVILIYHIFMLFIQMEIVNYLI